MTELLHNSFNYDFKTNQKSKKYFNDTIDLR